MKSRLVAKFCFFKLKNNSNNLIDNNNTLSNDHTKLNSDIIKLKEDNTKTNKENASQLLELKSFSYYQNNILMLMI